MYTEMKRLFLLPIFLFCMMIPVFGQQYTVISITGKVTAVKDDSNRELKLREKLSPQSVINIPYNSKVELLDERGSKKYTLKTPGQGSITNMMKDRNNAVMKLTGQYLSYIKARVKGNGELTSRRYSDPATVTREVAVASQSFDEQYIAFQREATQKYDQFRQQAIREYADFMRNAWKEFGAEPPRPKPVIEEVPPVVIPKIDDLPVIKSEPIKIEGRVLTLPMPKPQPIPANPIKEQLEDSVEYVEFTFYGTPMQVRFNGKEVFSLTSVTEDGVADVFEKLASSDFNNTIRDCLELRIHYQLSDWAYLQMLDALSKACFQTHNEATLLMGYLFQQTGYMMRLAISNDKLYMLYASNHIIYGQSYYILDNNEYYVYGGDINQIKLCEAKYPNEQQLSLWINQEPMLADSPTDLRSLQSQRYNDWDFEVSVNKNLIDFYASYPSSIDGDNIMTRWAVNGNVPIQEEVKQMLYPQMKEKLFGLSEQEAVERLLNWVQTAFVYEYDDVVWGYDRAFFAEETLFYPYADCEDRSILLSRLVRDLLGLKTVLIYYPGHLAMAVRFNMDVSGDYVELNGERYIVCDPTYIGARVGMTMPDMDNKTAKAILLK